MLGSVKKSHSVVEDTNNILFFSSHVNPDLNICFPELFLVGL